MIRGGQFPRLTEPKRYSGAKPQRGKRLEAGPFVGMRDSLDPSVSNDPKYARDLVNVMPLDLTGPSTFVGRPGFDKILSTQLGAAAVRTGQLVHHFVREDGGERTLLVVGGKLYNYTPTTDGVADVTAGGVTWETTARFYAVTFGDTVVYHDGTNTPRTKEPIANSGAAITNAPIFYGQMVVYYAKLFAIKNAERSVIVWSEENDPTIGYETVPYSNSWQLGQTDQEPLYALAATNEALYYFRARSIGSIRGAVTPEFTTDGTHLGISQSVGTVSPDGVCVVGERVFFIDADARPHVIEGGQAKPIYEGLNETIRGLDKTQLAKFSTRYDPTTGLVMFGVVEIGQSAISAILVYNPTLNIPVGVWRGFNVSAFGIVKPGVLSAPQTSGLTVEVGVPAMLHLHDDGYAYLHGTPNGTIWNDYLDSGTVGIAHAVETAHIGNDESDEKRFSRADLLFRVMSDTTAVNVRMLTPYGSGDALAGTLSQGGPDWDEYDWDDFVWGEDFAERKLAVGLNQVGRWARMRVEHQVTGERFGFTKAEVTVSPAGDAWQAA
jgi:hypothetical protein